MEMQQEGSGGREGKDSVNTGEYVGKEKKGPIALITLDRPGSLNVLGTRALRELDDSLTELERDEQIRALVITGGENFSAGADIKELHTKGPAEAEAFARLGQHVFRHIETMAKPVIAAIQGYALGGGCELALACDIRIAGEGAKLGQPEVNLGIMSGFGATYRLPRLVGMGKAKEMMLTGAVIAAWEAASIGLVNTVVKDGEVMERAEGIARALTGKSPISVKFIKELLNETTDMGKGLEREILAFAQCFAFVDSKEGILAFLEKRKPKFRGI